MPVFASVDVTYSFETGVSGVALLSPLSLSKATVADEGANVQIYRSPDSMGSLSLKRQNGRVTAYVDFGFGFPGGGTEHYAVVIRRVADAALSYCLDFAVERLPDVRAEQKAFINYRDRIQKQIDMKRAREH